MPERDRDRALAVSESVLDQVVQHLAHLVGVDPYLRQIVCNVDHEALGFDTRDNPSLHALVDERSHVSGYPTQFKASGVDSSDVEQFGDQSRESVGVTVDRFEHEPPLVLSEPIPFGEEGRSEALDTGQR